jgi:hypothetical protein
VAYLNHLYSVPLAEVEALRDDPDAPIRPSLSVSVSHLVAYWVQVQPLGRLLGQAIDGGLELNDTLRHQLRAPCYHGPEVVRTLYSLLVSAWLQVTSVEEIPPDDWYRIEIEKVLRVYSHAAERGECVVSMLEPVPVLVVKPKQ